MSERSTPPGGGLWRHPDFLRLWGGQTVSVFGSMITGTALPFTAILALDATPLEVAVLAEAEAEIDILVPIDECRVETANLLEAGAPDERGGGRDDLHRP